jgi:hypothetical protein
VGVSSVTSPINLHPISGGARWPRSAASRALESEGQSLAAAIDQRLASEKGSFAAALAKALASEREQLIAELEASAASERQATLDALEMRIRPEIRRALAAAAPGATAPPAPSQTGS